MIQLMLVVLVAFFPVSEIVLAVVKRSRGRSSQSEDRGSMGLLWLSIAVGMALAVAARGVSATRISLPAPLVQLLALFLMAGGLAIRWAAIITLGKLFTVDVAIHTDHAVIDRGVYHHMRHPSYTGLMVAFVGMGFYFGNWLSILVLLAAIVPGMRNRVAREERALLASLGPAYAAYCARTKQFIPGVW